MSAFDLRVRGAGDGAWQAGFGQEVWPCAVGRGGIRRDKREGDGATPIGRWPLRRIWFRPDRVAAPRCVIAPEALSPDAGWCDDPDDPLYNRAVTLPHAGRHEVLWRDDAVYDLIAVLGHNDDPPVPGAGSAIFLHLARPLAHHPLARPDYSGTEGCVALSEPHLRAFLAGCGRDSAVLVEEP